ncbi:hypothetical protein PGQ11_002967 [Apiospora arundinis]|uniref:Uncharacterized protein n=1 Tax=Apiospora arundinis TaxID=335852 RepID=A0ABR2J4J4_9PEZI
MLPSQRYGAQRPRHHGRPDHQQAMPPRRPAPAPAPASAPKTVAPSATQLQPQSQQPPSFPDVPNFFDQEGLESSPFSSPLPTSGDTQELLDKVGELLDKVNAVQSQLAHHNENTQKVDLFLQQTQRLTGWLSQVKALFERFVPVADADPLGDTFFDQV